MAFIKANPRRDHVYYNVVETVREGGQPRHNELLYIGRLDDLAPADRRAIEEELADIDPSLLSRFNDLLIKHHYDFDAEDDDSDYSLEDITPERALDYGPVAVLTSITNQLDLESILNDAFPPKGGGPPLGKLLLVQAISRCIEPRSIEATADWVPLTALGGLLELAPKQITRNTLYNSLDYVTSEGIERVHDDVWTRVRDIYETPEEPIFYDLTSSYFEGTECPIADYGYSSEHRPDKQQVVVGVAVNPDMIPIHHDVYTGDTADSKTVDEMTLRIDERGIADPVLVMDRGCATNPERERLRGESEDSDTGPKEYVAALKRHGEAKRCLAGRDPESFEKVTMPEGAAPLAVAELEPPSELTETDVRWVAIFNEEKAADDAAFRETQIERAGDALDQLAKRQRGQRPLSKQELQCRIKNTLSRHKTTKLLTVTVNERGPPRLSWEIDEEAVAKAAQLDGKALYETTCSNERLTPSEVACAYRDRDTVEKFIESIKDVVGLRPHYVRTEQHVRARIFVCVLSVLLLAVLELELAKAGREMTGMKALETLRGVRRVEFSAGSDQAVVVKTTTLSDEQADLAHVFDLSI
jgi:transposase